MSPAKTLLIAGALSTIALAAPTPALAPQTTGARTLHLRADADQATMLDLGARGRSIGDEQIASGTLVDSAERHVGTFGFTCKWVGFRNGAARESCHGWGSIAGGQLVVAGMSTSDTEHHVWAITDGTGVYRSARGQVRIDDLSDSASNVTIELAVPTLR